jgi:hypothetical protein
MSAVDGVPMDKCPKCGMIAEWFDNEYGTAQYACGSTKQKSYGYVKFYQSNACQRIADLQEKIKRMSDDLDRAYEKAGQ